MSRKVFTLEIEDEFQAKSEPVKKASVKVEKKSAGFEFGVSEINNSSAKKRVTQKTELGYEKNVCSASKKPVKAKVEEVEDYFDFCFKKPVKTVALAEKPEVVKTKAEVKVTEKPEIAKTKIVSEVKAEEKSAAKETKSTTKKPVTKKTTTTTKTVKKEPTKKTATTKKTQTKTESAKKATKIKEVVKEEVIKTEIEKFEEILDDDALRVVSVARIGSLFD